MTEYEKIQKRQDRQVEEKKKELRRRVRIAYKNGQIVPYDLGTLLDLRLGLKVIKAVWVGERYRN